jgi:hypothetical protein
VDLHNYATPILYSLLALLTAGFGVGMLVWQTGATQSALTTRKGMLAGGVLLVLFGGVVLVTQVWAIAIGSYSTLG